MREEDEQRVRWQRAVRLADLRLQLLRDLRSFAGIDAELIEAVARAADQHVLRVRVDEVLQTLARRGGIAVLRIEAGEIEVGDVGGIGAAELRLHVNTASA